MNWARRDGQPRDEAVAQRRETQRSPGFEVLDGRQHEVTLVGRPCETRNLFRSDRGVERPCGNPSEIVSGQVATEQEQRVGTRRNPRDADAEDRWDGIGTCLRIDANSRGQPAAWIWSPTAESQDQGTCRRLKAPQHSPANRPLSPSGCVLISREMNADEIKRLRADLACSVGELAAAMGVETRLVLAWESGDEFPTKKYSDKLRKLGEAGPTAIPRKSRAKGEDPLVALSDPRIWTILRKLLAHPPLRTEVERLAEKYDDPAKR